ncbi:MAG TPA: dual specificity protein phosphatase family protein [Thermoanaerobaculia bacterium]|jgi:protein tyrosine phosphatase (PTP) superfamily phosphohydrolase (DUF442 family)|nr:dual specificity protein phosphatase family protein [Thermoanaerobaculia bacterium]
MRSLGFALGNRLVLTLSLAFLLDSYAAPAQQHAATECSRNCDSGIENFHEVASGILWRGAKPDPAGAAWLIQHGVKTIVNLEVLHDDQEVFRQASFVGAAKSEIDYFRIADWEPNAVIAQSLLDNHVAHFLAVLNQEPKPIYVHCRSGQNRTGVMVAAYKVIVENASADDAIEDMKSYQGIWFAADADYIRSLSSERITKIREMMQVWIPKLKAESRIVCENAKCDIVDL